MFNAKKVIQELSKTTSVLEFSDKLNIFPEINNAANIAANILKFVDTETLFANGPAISKDWYQAILGTKFNKYSLSIIKLKKYFSKLIDFEIFNYYVRPIARKQPNAKESFHAITVVSNFILSTHLRSLLVLGDSGYGKSLLGQYIVWQLLKYYKLGKPIPLFIHLPSIPENKRKTKLLQHYLKTAGLDRSEIINILQEPLVLVLDGYDEIPEVGNLYVQNHWDNLNIKTITTCRPEALVQRQNSYQELFLPKRTTTHTERKCFAEIYLSRFNSEQVNRYLAQYLKNTNSTSNWQDYRQQLESIPGLLELAVTPFILSMVVKVLPNIIKKHQSQKISEQRKLVRIEIYDYFVDYWFDYQAGRLQEQGKLINLKGSIKNYLKTYSQNLAYYALRAGKLEIIIEEQYTLNKNLLQPKDDKLLLDYQKDVDKFTLEVIAQIRSGCLLKTGVKYFSFLHKSLIEYFAAQDLFAGVYLNLDTYLKELNLTNFSANFGLNENLLTNEAAIIYTLSDRVLVDDNFKQLLYDVIEFSKKQPLVNIAAANSMTILNAAGESFSTKDFSKTHISGANLSGAVCDSTNFSGADLRGTNFNHAWLRCANFSGANLQNVNFAELPSIKHACKITSMCIDPKGHWLLIGDMEGNLTKWSLDFDKKVSSNRISSSGSFLKTMASFIGFAPIKLTISPDGKLAAIANLDGRVHLWDIQQNKQINEFILENKYLRYHEPGEFMHETKLKNTMALIDILLFCPPDGKKLIFGCTYCNNIEMRDIINNEYICNFPTREKQGSTTRDLAISPDGKTLVFSSSLCDSWDSTIGDSEDDCVILNLDSDSDSDSDSEDDSLVSDRGNLKIPKCNKFNLELYDLTNLVFRNSYYIKRIAIPTLIMPIIGEFNNIVFSPTGKWLGGITISYDIELLNTKTWKADKIIHLSNSGNLDAIQKMCMFLIEPPNGLSFSANEELLVVSFGKELQIFHIESGSYMYNLLYPETDKKEGSYFEYPGDYKFYFGKGPIFSPLNNQIYYPVNNQVCSWLIKVAPNITKDQSYFNKKLDFIKHYIAVQGKEIILGTFSKTETLEDENIKITLTTNELLCNLLIYNDKQLLHDIKFETSGYSDSTKLMLSPNKHYIVIYSAGNTQKRGTDPLYIRKPSFFYDTKIRVWDLKAGKLIHNFSHHKQIKSMIFSNDSKWLITYGYTVRIWDMGSGNCLQQYNKKDCWVDAVALTSNKIFLAIANSNGSLTVWHTITHKQTYLPCLLAEVYELFFSNDDKYLITHTYGGNVFIFNFSKEQPSLHLVNRNNNSILNCFASNINDAIGLSSANQLLFKQKGAIGMPSKYNIVPKESNNINQNLLYVYNSQAIIKTNIYSVVNHKLPVLYNDWVISIMRKPHADVPDHAFLVLEGVDQFGNGLLFRYDAVDSRYKPGTVGIVEKLFDNIEPKDLKHIFCEKIIDKAEIYHKSWSIPRIQALALIADINQDKTKDIIYHISGKDSIFVKSMSIDGHSCFTWAREKLHNLNDERVRLPEKWSDLIVAKTSFYIDNADTKEDNCLVM